MSKQSVWLAAGLLAGLWASPATATTAAQEPIQPIEAAVIKDPAKVELGKAVLRSAPVQVRRHLL